MKNEPSNLLQSVLDSLPDAIRIVDEDYRILYLNHAAAREAGREAKELLGSKCYRACYGQLAPCSFCHTSQAFDTGESYESQMTRTGPQGERRALEVSSFPIKDASGQVRQVIESTRDVTARTALEEQVRRSERLATAGELAAGMAHEIRNPLGSIVTAANLLEAEKGRALDDDHLTLLAVVKKEARRLNAILTDFLLFARPREPRPKATNVNELALDTLLTLQADSKTAARLRGGENAVELVTDLDQSVRDVALDRDQMKQVLLNVVLNGLQAMKTGGKLTVATEERGSNIHITVRDSGKGIPAKHLERIFEPFFSSKSEGTGLGLPIAQHIVHAHKGSILVESEEGKGTLVTISLLVT